MVSALAECLQNRSQNRTTLRFLSNICEIVAFCPGCKTMETLWFEDGRLTSTRKFNQQGELVFHDCGTLEPCRLYRQG